MRFLLHCHIKGAFSIRLLSLLFLFPNQQTPLDVFFDHYAVAPLEGVLVGDLVGDDIQVVEPCGLNDHFKLFHRKCPADSGAVDIGVG